MAKYAQGIFTPRHPEKYIGKGAIIYRSSWEQVFFQLCDNHPGILQWASEAIRIPYRNPLTGKQTIYVPDVFILYQDAKGKSHAELVEIKPSSEANLLEARSERDRLMVAVNTAKWAAAKQFCQAKGIVFRVITQRDIFHYGNKR